MNCGDGYFRSGDATPQNNVCKPIPAGYREKLVSEGAAVAKSEIVLCEIGTYSAWSSGVRDPVTSTVCGVCDLNTYAPRKGMQKCVACKAGTIPNQSASTADILGPDQCVSCSDTTYRAAFTASATCTTCPAGSETGPSNHAACTPCRPGYVSNGTASDCSPCGVSPWAAFGAVACSLGAGQGAAHVVHAGACPLPPSLHSLRSCSPSCCPCPTLPAGSHVPVHVWADYVQELPQGL